MARSRKLKVYKTPAGFYDAYVAAPSRKAALEAWGSDADLFARGLAEEVTDAALMREPLDHPGTVIRRSRGSYDEQVAALPPDRPRRAQDGAAPPRPSRKEAPRPSRQALDRAERARDDLLERQAEAERELRTREEALRRERRELERSQERERAAAERSVDEGREAFDAATARWKSDSK